MSRRYLFSLFAIAIGAAIAGIFVARMLMAPATPALESGTLLPEPRELAPFRLVDARGTPADSGVLRGHPTLVFFGFTHCPDVCPTTLALLANVRRQVDLPGLTVALISVDPERDTPEKLAPYVAAFAEDFIGLTGEPSEIRAVTRSFGVASTRVDLAGDSYTVDHSATVFALDSAARIVAIFTPPFDSAALARDLQRLAPRLRPPGS